MAKSTEEPRADYTVSHQQAHHLAGELRQKLAGEVRFDHGSRALYAADGSLYRQVPIGVVVPRSIDEVVARMLDAAGWLAPLVSSRTTINCLCTLPNSN